MTIAIADTFTSESIDVDLDLTADDEEPCVCDCPKVATHVASADASCNCVNWRRILLCLPHAEEGRQDHMGHVEYCVTCDAPLTWIAIVPIHG